VFTFLHFTVVRVIHCCHYRNPHHIDISLLRYGYLLIIIINWNNNQRDAYYPINEMVKVGNDGVKSVKGVTTERAFVMYVWENSALKLYILLLYSLCFNRFIEKSVCSIQGINIYLTLLRVRCDPFLSWRIARVREEWDGTPQLHCMGGFCNRHDILTVPYFHCRVRWGHSFCL